jgi:DNA-binding MarR family transcriptional regulator
VAATNGERSKEDWSHLIDEVGQEFSELRQAAQRLDEAVATLFGLNRTDLRCLAVLYHRGRATAGELAEAAGLSPGAMTAALDRLERSGFANRVADPEDRRRVMVVSTVATREVGARLFGEVEVAGRKVLEPYNIEEVTAIRDYLRVTRGIYESQAAQLAAAGASANEAAAAATAATPDFSAPLGDVRSARLEFNKGAARVVIRGDEALGQLYHAHFDGSVPDVFFRGSTVTIQQRRRFRPFDWRAQSSDVLLNVSIPWAISLRGGMWKLDADLHAIRLESLELSGGASDVEVRLPRPEGTVPVRISGGASKVVLHRPTEVPVRAVASGGASQVLFDGERASGLGARGRLVSPGYDAAADRYEIRFSGGASQLTIDTL